MRSASLSSIPLNQKLTSTSGPSTLLRMPRLSYALSKKGQLNLPGVTHASKTTVEDLLLKDAEAYHCLFDPVGLHNHLSHHLLAAYDLGSSATHLRKMYDQEAQVQRPRILEESDKSIVIDEDNWIQYLGNDSAYNAFVTFFSDVITEIGVTGALEKFVFEESANMPGVLMLDRVISGIVHPFIVLGYGTEFGNDTLIATGLAQAAVHSPTITLPIEVKPTCQPITLLEVLREVYDSKTLNSALPYDPKSTTDNRINTILANGGAAIQEICASYYISDTITDAEIAQITEECIWVGTLLTFGTGRKGRKLRLDFFLMHILTSSLFLRPFCAVLRKREHKAALLRAFIPILVIVVLIRGGPRIDPELLMSYTDVPRPPLSKDLFPAPLKSSLGAPAHDADYNPWPALIEGVKYHPDPHVLKVMRTLIYGAQHFGTVPPGGVMGTFRFQVARKDSEETHVGMAKVDGTLFVRAAGLLMDTLGWVGYGQREGQWDRSGLGWDEAWENED